MLHTSFHHPRALLLSFVLLGCGAEEDIYDDEVVSQQEQAIEQGTRVAPRSDYERSTVGLERSSGVGYCTGTLVAKNLVLTAAHCNPRSGDRIRFYSEGRPAVRRTASGKTLALALPIDRVFYPDGINMADGDCGSTSNSCDDLEGRLADLAVVHIKGTIPAGYAPALLPSAGYDAETGVGEPVTAVGTGAHASAMPGGKEMRFVNDKILAIDSDAVLWLSNDVTDKGDSGGPIYAKTYAFDRKSIKVIGVLRGEWWRVASAAMRSRYTVVRDHMRWLRSVIDGTVDTSSILEVTGEGCGGTVRFVDGLGKTHTFLRGDGTPQVFPVASPDVHWTCDESDERTGCPTGTNVVKAYRTEGRSFTVECRRDRSLR